MARPTRPPTSAPDRRQTLSELERYDWGPPKVDSYLVTTCHRLRHKPIGDFSVEDLRIMIGQGIGLPFLMPLAADVLEEEPFASGDLYRGDLLKTFLQVSSAFWSQAPDLLERARAIAEHASSGLHNDGDSATLHAEERTATKKVPDCNEESATSR